MKFGIRKYSPRKRWSARTSYKRYVKHNLGFKLPKGSRAIFNSKKYAHDKIYHKVSFDIFKMLFKLFK